MNVFIVGINGKMGKAISCLAETQDDVKVVGGFDVVKGGAYPVFDDVRAVNVAYDCVIDFSRPSTLDDVIYLAKSKGVPAVIATTGYSDEQLAKIKELSKTVPVFRSANMSLGVNVVERVLPILSSLLSGYDVEIVEAHHNQKADAPSGTALQMLDAVKKGLDYAPNVVNGRSGLCKREKGDIGVHAVRGGTIVGEHTVIFAGEDEVIEIKHTAFSRKIFAQGTLTAARFLQGKKTGMYDMTDYLESVDK